jgi:hypothetical protein
VGRDAQVSIGLAVPGRPIRSLVAEDRSAAGVRDQTGPDGAAAPYATACPHEGVVTRGWPHPAVEVVANGTTVYEVILRKPVVRVL